MSNSTMPQPEAQELEKLQTKCSQGIATQEQQQIGKKCPQFAILKKSAATQDPRAEGLDALGTPASKILLE